MSDDVHPEASPVAIATRLHLTRQVFGLSQKAFAARAGIVFTTYEVYELAERRPPLDDALSICKAFDLTLDWLYAGDIRGLPLSVAEAIKRVRRLGTMKTSGS
jgi:transcriptional regulator with XRE-family HTH domain